MSLVHNLKLLCFCDREWISNNLIPTPNIAWTSLTSKDFEHYHPATPYLCEVLTNTCNVPTMHHHQESSSGKTPEEGTTPFVTEQYFGPCIPENHCVETPQHVDKLFHLSNLTSTPDCLDKPSTLDVPDDHPLELDSTSLAFQLQDTSSFEIEFVPEIWTMPIFCKQRFFLNYMTMNSCS